LLTARSKLVDKLGQAVRTQLVDGLLADLLQDVRFLRVYVLSVGIHFTAVPARSLSCVVRAEPLGLLLCFTFNIFILESDIPSRRSGKFTNE
jgi:hypothetical protein